MTERSNNMFHILEIQDKGKEWLVCAKNSWLYKEHVQQYVLWHEKESTDLKGQPNDRWTAFSLFPFICPTIKEKGIKGQVTFASQ